MTNGVTICLFCLTYPSWTRNETTNATNRVLIQVISWFKLIRK